MQKVFSTIEMVRLNIMHDDQIIVVSHTQLLFSL